jgi:hypothetical protein
MPTTARKQPQKPKPEALTDPTPSWMTPRALSGPSDVLANVYQVSEKYTRPSKGVQAHWPFTAAFIMPDLQLYRLVPPDVFSAFPDGLS